MKRILTIGVFLLGWVMLLQAQYAYKSHAISVNGTSNVHEWVSNVKEVKVDADLMFAENGNLQLKKMNVSIPVKSIKSTKGSIMDNKTYGALKEDKFPAITYQLTKPVDVVKAADGYSLSAMGNLTIAGKAKVVTLAVKGKTLADGSIQFDGSYKLLMTDYGIDPPTALMGTMKTGNEVTIKYQLILKKL